MTTHYLSSSQVAELLGINPGTYRDYIAKGLAPEPDVTIGKIAGWLPETIRDWDKKRPGRGARTDLR